MTSIFWNISAIIFVIIHTKDLVYCIRDRNFLTPITLQPEGKIFKYNTTPYAGILPNHIHKGANKYIQDIDNLLKDPDSYIADGRLLKQYLVVENHPDDIYDINSFGPSPIVYERLSGKIYPRMRRLNLNVFSVQDNSLEPSYSYYQKPELVTLGSGSLGYIRLPNGAAFLGSGSLGFVSNSDRIQSIIQSRSRKGPQPGPLTFGQLD